MTNETTKTNDDNRPALVLIQGGRTDDAPRAQAASELTQSERDNTFMAIACAVAIEEAKLMPTTAEVEQQAKALVEFTKAQLAARDAVDAQKAIDDAR